MKRPRSSDDLESYIEKDSSVSRSSRSSYHGKGEIPRKGGSGFSASPFSSNRYDRDRSGDEDGREVSRKGRKRLEHEFDGIDRRKVVGLGFDRYGSREGHNCNSSSGGSVHRSSGREFPKGFRSERDRSRREGSGMTSWRRFGCGGKEFEENGRGYNTTRECGNEEKSSSIVVKESSRGLKRETKSPTRSRDSGSEQSRSIEGAKKGEQRRGSVAGRNCGGPASASGRDDAKMKSSISKAKSPNWSKDSESERSKSVEAGKINADIEPVGLEKEAKSTDLEQTKNKQGNSSGEIEEGELAQEKELEKDFDSVDQCKQREGSETTVNVVGVITVDSAVVSRMEDAEQNVEQKQKFLENAAECDGKEEGGINTVNEEKFEGESLSKPGKSMDECKRGETEAANVKDQEELGFDLEVKLEDGRDGSNVPQSQNQNAKDKGKKVIRLSSTCDTVNTDDMEGPSTRGFELFSTSPVRRSTDQQNIEKEKEDKLTLEPFDLSLSLPNVLLPIRQTRDSVQPPGSPSQVRSVQSFSTFRTNSDGFTASMSFSGSQSFFHNPSCSLTHNTMDLESYEQSVHSRPIFQGIDQVSLQNELKQKDIPLYQRSLANGNGLSHPNSQSLQGNSKISNGVEKQLIQKQVKNHDDTRSPVQSVGSHKIGSNYSLEKKQLMKGKHGTNLYRSNSQKNRHSLPIESSEFVDNVIGRLVSDPIYVMAKIFNDMPPQSALLLKESICDIMINLDKQGQVSVFLSALQSRSDLTMDNLLKAHRTQLEILVALRTGVKDYLQVDSSTPSSDLAEVFLNLRCRNLSCRSLLPVDECDCKVCSKNTGFCSTCMCLVCSKFDTASNTCSWVGCDVCLHFCHADCALRESFIRNGRGDSGQSEMQFHCVACDHPSEMFGFVKEVFQNFSKDWSAERFCKELEYVRRIFSASKDARGRRLYEIADMMLPKLANKSNLPEVFTYTMNFLTAESVSSKVPFPGKEQANCSNGIAAGPSKETSWFRSACAEKSPSIKRSSNLLTFHDEVKEKPQKTHRNSEKEPLFAELESIVRIKQVEAEMFQSRADDARRESEGLRRIAILKNEKIEEEFNKRLAKLRLPDAEEMRKLKFEEFQALERAHREFSSMKMRMEADIEDLLLKMESTKRNLAV